MSAYIFIFIFLLVCSIFSKKNSILFIMAFVLMLFVAGFRDTSVGTDTQNYYEIYEYFRLETYPSWFTIEPGWRVINNLAVKMHAGYSMVVFLASLFTLVPIFLPYGSIVTDLLCLFCFFIYYFFIFSHLI